MSTELRATFFQNPFDCDLDYVSVELPCTVEAH